MTKRLTLVTQSRLFQVEVSTVANGPNDILKVTVDKFIFIFPAGVRYSESGLWIKQEDGLARIGLSDFAQQRNGDILWEVCGDSPFPKGQRDGKCGYGLPHLKSDPSSQPKWYQLPFPKFIKVT